MGGNVKCIASKHFSAIFWGAENTIPSPTLCSPPPPPLIIPRILYNLTLFPPCIPKICRCRLSHGGRHAKTTTTSCVFPEKNVRKFFWFFFSSGQLGKRVEFADGEGRKIRINRIYWSCFLGEYLFYNRTKMYLGIFFEKNSKCFLLFSGNWLFVHGVHVWPYFRAPALSKSSHLEVFFQSQGYAQTYTFKG